MNSLDHSIFYALVTWLFIVPGLTLFHELGHALMAIMLTGQRVTVQLGRRPGVFQFSCGKIDFHLRPSILPVSFYEMSDWQRATRQQLAWIALAGPLTSLLLMVLAMGFAMAAEGLDQTAYFLASGTALLALLQFLFSMVPVRYPRWLGAYAGHWSDGYRGWYLLASKQEEHS
jgi:hypothetical protein